MILRKWEDLPAEMRTDAVRPYYDILSRKTGSLLLKRLFDIVVSACLLLVLSPVFLLLAIAVKIDSPGPVFYRQVRVTQYGKKFRIFKFRTMVSNADKIGTQVTVGNDNRITRVGKLIRKCRLDEISQLIDILRGTMTFVGTRPEVPKYVSAYTPEMMATLLLPAGVTSEASILYKDEAELLEKAEDVDAVYIRDVLPGKMHYNLAAMQNFSFWSDIATMFRTVFAVFGLAKTEAPAADTQERKPCSTVTFGVIAYNEHQYLPDLLQDLLNQSYPRHLTEVILVDGRSTDDTLQIMEDFRAAHLNEYLSIQVLDNPKRIQPAGWNVVIQNSTADVILRIDAHAKIPHDFIAQSMACINTGEDVCGGPRENMIDEHTPWKRMLLDAELSLFGSGFAPYRRETTEKKYVNSLFHGAYRRDVFVRAGMFNEDLIRTEDNEIHYRIRQHGYRICYDPSIRSSYQTRNTLPKMLKQKYQNGLWIGRTLSVCPQCISLFHLVPFSFVCAMIVTLILAVFQVWWPLLALLAAYCAFLAVNTLTCLCKTKNVTDLLLPVIYFLMHTAYGVGTITGLLKKRA